MPRAIVVGSGTAVGIEVSNHVAHVRDHHVITRVPLNGVIPQVADQFVVAISTENEVIASLPVNDVFAFVTVDLVVTLNKVSVVEPLD